MTPNLQSIIFRQPGITGIQPDIATGNGRLAAFCRLDQKSGIQHGGVAQPNLLLRLFTEVAIDLEGASLTGFFSKRRRQIHTDACQVR